MYPYSSSHHCAHTPIPICEGSELLLGAPFPASLDLLQGEAKRVLEARKQTFVCLFERGVCWQAEDLTLFFFIQTFT